MLYLLCCIVFMLIAIKRMLGIMHSTMSGDAPQVRPLLSLVKVLLAAAIAVAVAAPILNTVLDGVAYASKNGVGMSTGNASVWIAFAGALAAIGYYGAGLVAAYKSGHMGFGRTGRLVAPVACAALVLLITGIQLEFARHKDAGFVSLAIMRDQVHDMQCRSDIVLARWNQSEGTPVVYRCPHEITLNSFSSTPFIPWPGYRQGESADLAKAMGEILKSSKSVNEN